MKTSRILPLTLVPALVAGGVAAQDLTLSGPAERIDAPTAYEWDAGSGDVAEGDVRSVGTGLQYTGVLLNVGAGVNNVFIKVQNQDGDTEFESGACYTGNNGDSFGLGYFGLDQPFTTAHLRAERLGDTITLSLTNVDGGTKADQQYVCNGAPPPEGDDIGVNGFNNIAQIDNFAAGGGVLETFSFVGPLASSGNWADIDPGMNANGAVASGGFAARSVWIGGGGGYDIELGFCDTEGNPYCDGIGLNILGDQVSVQGETIGCVSGTVAGPLSLSLWPFGSGVSLIVGVNPGHSYVNTRTQELSLGDYALWRSLDSDGVVFNWGFLCAPPQGEAMREAPSSDSVRATPASISDWLR
jgi:hypothetical protein